MIKNNTLAEVAALLNKIKRAAVFCHIRPDGDSLGSGLALCLALKNAGKEAYMICEDKPPLKLAFLPCMNEVYNELPTDKNRFDAFISVDCADSTRLGSSFTAMFTRFPGVTLNIDHHISNSGFAKYNYVYDCTATCEILPEIFAAAGFGITKDMADLLMAGLLTDSGNFSHNDVSAKTFSVASLLKEKGADVSRENYILFKAQSKQRALLFGRVMNKMRFFLDDRFIVITVKQSDLDETGADGAMTEGMVDFPLSVEGTEVSASVMEVREGQYKVSLRSNGKVNVNAAASRFGGGGHILASGCMIFGEYEEVVERLVYAVSMQL